jgi:hypothetical protein
MKSYFLNLTYILSVFTIFSSIYLDTYWNEFHVNIFQYIEISDLINYGLKPLLKKSIPLAIGLLILFVFFDKIFPYGGYQDLKHKEKNTGTKHISIFEKIMYWFFLVVFFILYPIKIVYSYFSDINYFYSHLPYFASIFSLLLTNRLIKYKYIDNVNIDFKIIFFSSYLIVSSFTLAKTESKLIIDNIEFNYTYKNEKVMKVIGIGKDFYFLRQIGDDSTIIFNKNKIDSMEIDFYDGNLRTRSDSIIYDKIQKLSTTMN